MDCRDPQRVTARRLPARARAGGPAGGVLWMTLVAAGCERGSATAPVPFASGRYALVSYNGATVPADIGPLPSRDGGPTGCRVVVTAGSLTLDIPAGRFSAGYQVNNSCTDASLGSNSSEGLVTQRGRELLFRVPRVAGDTVMFTGSWAPGAVTIGQGTTEVLVYK